MYTQCKMLNDILLSYSNFSAQQKEEEIKFFLSLSFFFSSVLLDILCIVLSTMII